jgi:hypothetical protein
MTMDSAAGSNTGRYEIRFIGELLNSGCGPFRADTWHFAEGSDRKFLPDILDPDASAPAQALSGVLDATQKPAVVFELIVEPFIPKTLSRSPIKLVSGGG